MKGAPSPGTGTHGAGHACARVDLSIIDEWIARGVPTTAVR